MTAPAHAEGITATEQDAITAAVEAAARGIAEAVGFDWDRPQWWHVPDDLERFRDMYRFQARAAVAAAAPIIAAAERERIALSIDETFARWERGEIERPKYERGGFLNDRDWCAAIARAGTSGEPS